MITKQKLQAIVPFMLVFTLLIPCAANVHVRWNFDKGNGGIYHPGDNGKLNVWIENVIEENSKRVDETRYVGNIRVKVQYPSGIDGTISNFYPATLAPGTVGPVLSHDFSISPDAEQGVYSFKIKVWYDQNYTDPYKPSCCQEINIMNNYLEVNGNQGEQPNYIRVQRVAEKTNLTQISDKLDGVSRSLQTVENELKKTKPEPGITIYKSENVSTTPPKLSLISSAGAVVGAVGSTISSIGSVISAVVVGILSITSFTILVLGALVSAGLLSIVVIQAMISILLSAALLFVLIFVVIAIVDFLIILFIIWLIIRIIQHLSKKKKK